MVMASRHPWPHTFSRLSSPLSLRAKVSDFCLSATSLLRTIVRLVYSQTLKTISLASLSNFLLNSGVYGGIFYYLDVTDGESAESITLALQFAVDVNTEAFACMVARTVLVPKDGEVMTMIEDVVETEVIPFALWQ